MSKRKIYKLKIKTPSGDYTGDFYSPHPEKRLSDVISRQEGYLNLKNVTLSQTGEKYPFVIFNKDNIEMIILVEEMAEENELLT